MSPLYVFSQSLLIVVAALAFWRGRFWEKATATILLINWIGTSAAPRFNYIEPPWMIMVIDGCVGLFLLYAALFSGRTWSLWAAAFQLLLMANHVAFIRFQVLEQWAYVTAYMVWGDMVLVTLAIGVMTRKHRGNSPNDLTQDENDHGRR